MSALIEKMHVYASGSEWLLWYSLAIYPCRLGRAIASGPSRRPDPPTPRPTREPTLPRPS